MIITDHLLPNNQTLYYFFKLWQKVFYNIVLLPSHVIIMLYFQIDDQKYVCSPVEIQFTVWVLHRYHSSKFYSAVAYIKRMCMTKKTRRCVSSISRNLDSINQFNRNGSIGIGSFKNLLQCHISLYLCYRIFIIVG